MDWLKSCQGLTQWDLFTLGPSLIPITVLNHKIFTTKPSPPKMFSIWLCRYFIKNQGLTQWALVPLGLSLISTTVLKHQNFTTKTSLPKMFSRWFWSYWKKLPCIKPMGLGSIWDVSYYNNCLEPPKFHYQTFSSKTVFYLILEW